MKPRLGLWARTTKANFQCVIFNHLNEKWSPLQTSTEFSFWIFDFYSWFCYLELSKLLLSLIWFFLTLTLKVNYTTLILLILWAKWSHKHTLHDYILLAKEEGEWKGRGKEGGRYRSKLQILWKTLPQRNTAENDGIGHPTSSSGLKMFTHIHTCMHIPQAHSPHSKNN